MLMELLSKASTVAMLSFVVSSMLARSRGRLPHQLPTETAVKAGIGAIMCRCPK
jgi:hypothetical protein